MIGSEIPRVSVPLGLNHQLSLDRLEDVLSTTRRNEQQPAHRSWPSIPYGVNHAPRDEHERADLPLPPDAALQCAVSLEPGTALNTREDFTVHNVSAKQVVAYALTFDLTGAEVTPAAATPAL
jgi:hypothetical protein